MEDEGDTSPHQFSTTMLSLETLLADLENFTMTTGEHGQVRGGVEREPHHDLEAEVDDLTEKLRTAMASGLEIETSLGRCSACRKEINEKSVVVGEETYHEDCFVCSACSVRLTGRYHLVRGQYYCEEDREVNLPRCDGCHQPLTDLSFHPACFICTVCTQPIQGKFFKDQESGDFLCVADYQERRTKCCKCGLAILDKSLTFQGEEMHPSCFRCDKCGDILPEGNHVLEGNKPLCQTCYSTHFAPKCVRCCTAIVFNGNDDPNTTKLITCGGGDYHLQCYTCQNCHTGLEGKRVFISDLSEELICETCNRNAR